MRWFAVPTSMLLLAAYPFATPADARKNARLSSEVHIQQAQGRMPAAPRTSDDSKLLKGIPEGTTNPADAAKGSPSIPATCTQQNASSPACYSATQQARPVAK
jgi:hypothetical protein